MRLLTTSNEQDCAKWTTVAQLTMVCFNILLPIWSWMSVLTCCNLSQFATPQHIPGVSSSSCCFFLQLLDCSLTRFNCLLVNTYIYVFCVSFTTFTTWKKGQRNPQPSTSASQHLNGEEWIVQMNHVCLPPAVQLRHIAELHQGL